MGKPVCSTAANSSLNCGINEEPLGATITISNSGSNACPTMPPAINVTAGSQCTLVTGTGTKWVTGTGCQLGTCTVKVGSIFMTCDTGAGQTCPVAGKAEAQYVVQVTDDTHIIIAGKYDPNGNSNSTTPTAWYFFPPTISPIIFWEGAYSANSTSRDGFGDVMEDIRVDCESVPYCVDWYSTNAQERDILRHSSMSINACVFQSGTTATSNTSNIIGTGSFTFITNVALGLDTDHSVRVTDQSNSANFIVGTVTSNVGTTLQITETSKGGSGTINAWNITNNLSPCAPGNVNNNQTNQAGFFADRTFQPTGVSGPAHWEAKENEFNVGAGYQNDEAHWAYGVVIEGWQLGRGSPNDSANSDIDFGTVNGKAVPQEQGSAFWIDGVYRINVAGSHIESSHFEAIKVGAGQDTVGTTTGGVRISDISVTNLVTTKSIVRLYAANGGSVIAAQLSNLVTANSNTTSLVQDDNIGGLTVQGSNCSSSSTFNASCVLTYYASGGILSTSPGFQGNGGTRKLVGADYSNSTTTPSTVVSWTLPAMPSTGLLSYGYRCDFIWENTTGTTGSLVLGVNISSAPTQITAGGKIENALSGAEATGYISNATTGNQTVITGSNPGVVNTPYYATIFGTIESAATTGGTFAITGKSSTATQNIVIKRGMSTCDMWIVEQ